MQGMGMVSKSGKLNGAAPAMAVVVGLDSVQGLQLARNLAGKGVELIGVARKPESHFARTNVCREILYCDTKSEEVIELLVSLGKRLEKKAVIYACTDISVLIIARCRAALDEWYHTVLPDVEVVECLLDKPNFYTYIEREELPLPPTALLTSRADAEAAAERIPFPAILKPAKKTTQWEQNSTQKVYRVETPAELLDLYDRAANWTDVLIVQEEIPGPERNLITCYCYFTQAGELASSFVSRKLRQFPPDIGNACLREEARNEDVRQHTVELFRGVGYRGLGYAEMKIDERDGKAYFIEANIGRPGGASAIAEANGVDLHYALYCDALGWPLPPNLTQTYRGVKWIFLGNDLRAAFRQWRQGDLSLAEWWRSISGPKRFALLSLRDPAPGLQYVLGGLKGRSRRREHPDNGR